MESVYSAVRTGSTGSTTYWMSKKKRKNKAAWTTVVQDRNQGQLQVDVAMNLHTVLKV
jgi:hypothetical protein